MKQILLDMFRRVDMALCVFASQNIKEHVPATKYFGRESNFRDYLWLNAFSKNTRKQRPGTRPYVRFDSHILDRYAFRKTHIRLAVITTSTNVGSEQIKSILSLLPVEKLGKCFQSYGGQESHTWVDSLCLDRTS